MPGISFWSGTYTIFQAIEKILVVVGVPIAAYWTWYTFSTTDTEKSRINYEVKLARAKNFGLQIEIICNTSIISGREYITGGIDIFNMGAGLVTIDVSNSDVMVASKLNFDRTGVPKLTNKLKMPFLTDHPSAHKAQAFVPQRRRFLPFSLSPGSHGVYFIRFNAPVSFSNDDNSLTSPRIWGASTTVVANGRPGNRCGTPSPG